MTSMNAEKYLPSKKFAWFFLGIICIAGIILLVVNRIDSKNSYTTAPIISSEGTVNDIVTRDSNKNGIADWEESLWGLDPKGDGAANKAVIDQKKAAAKITADQTPETQTDRFSQELISTILALRQSGTLTPAIVARVAEAVGNSTDAKHTNPTTYTTNDMTIVPDSAQAKIAYKTKLKKVIDQYSNVDLGGEMSIIAGGLDGGGENLKRLQPLSEAYTALSKQIIAIPTPKTVSQNALDLANASAQMGSSLLLVENLYSDALSGMIGLDDYIKANNLSDMATQTLAVYFKQ